MPGALSDNFMEVTDADHATTMASPGKAIGATSFNITDATDWPTDTAIVVAIRNVDTTGKEIGDTYTEWPAVLSGTTLSLGATPAPLIGNDQEYTAASTTQVYTPLSSTSWNRLIQAILQSLNQDGSLQLGAIQDVMPAGSLVPTGVTLPFAGPSAPSGFLLCQGQAVSRSTYAALFTLIGTTFGAGDGTTTFNVPDMRQRFPLGKAASGTGNALGGFGGSIDHVHPLSSNGYAKIDRGSGINIGHNRVNGVTSWAATEAWNGLSEYTTDTTSHSSGTTLGGTTDDQNPPWLALNYIIKT